MEELNLSISKKLAKFKASFGTSWEDFSMDGCSSSQSDKDLTRKKITTTFASKKRAAVKSPREKRKSSRRAPLSVEATSPQQTDEMEPIPPSPPQQKDETGPIPPSLA
ncbi:hypothetical protein AAC387_Pa12g0966 [Persea americana]